MKVDAALFAPAASAGATAARMEREAYNAAWSFEGAHCPFLPLAMAAQHTKRLQLGTAIAVAFARNPMLCAQQANDLQTISRGRFVLGLGAQIRPHITRRFGQPWSRPAARMHEFVRAIRAIWHAWESGGALRFEGEFYRHTLMTPAFNPGPNRYGNPPIFVAGVGPRMTQTAGEVADGFFVHPFHSPEFLHAETLPALQRGRAKAKRAEFEISCQTIVALGANETQLQRAREKAKMQLAFYGSTPAYRGVLLHHGYGELQTQLKALSKAGRWTEMPALIDDALFDLLAVSGAPAEVGAKLVARNAGFAQRTTVMLYDETGAPETPAQLVQAAANAA